MGLAVEREQENALQEMRKRDNTCAGAFGLYGGMGMSAMHKPGSKA
jgi:hypothetical protein